MNPHVWTLGMCRDFLAECKGNILPIPATLDAVAGALPEGIVWREIKYKALSKRWVVAADRESDGLIMGWSDGETEILARARAACLAWILFLKEITNV